jgi:hypothetical protein
MMAEAIKQVEASDIVVIVGTSMVVSPANTLVSFAHPQVPVYIVDPQRPKRRVWQGFPFHRGAGLHRAAQAGGQIPRRGLIFR